MQSIIIIVMGITTTVIRFTLMPDSIITNTIVAITTEALEEAPSIRKQECQRLACDWDFFKKGVSNKKKIRFFLSWKEADFLQGRALEYAFI